MTDVFISYAREDKAAAQKLANFLESHGVDVWWDAEILGSDDFYEVILQALSKAKAAVVIWSKSSVKSRFVRDEARFALHHDKLVATKMADVEVIEIPFGFQGQHTDDVAAHDRVLLAVEKLGVKPAPAPIPAAPVPVARSQDSIEWDAVKTSVRAEDLLDFLGKHPKSMHRGDCLARLRSLTTGGAPATSIATAHPAPVGRLRAFLSGFSLRLPEFQSLQDGLYAAIGGAVFYIALVIAAPLIIMVSMSPEPYGYWVLGTVCLLIALFGHQRFNGWLKQRNFKAAIITALAAAGIFSLGTLSFSELVFTGRGDSEVFTWLGATGLLAMAYFALLLYRAR